LDAYRCVVHRFVFFGDNAVHLPQRRRRTRWGADGRAKEEYIYLYLYLHTYMYIYRERGGGERGGERERERERDQYRYRDRDSIDIDIDMYVYIYIYIYIDEYMYLYLTQYLFVVHRLVFLIDDAVHFIEGRRRTRRGADGRAQEESAAGVERAGRLRCFQNEMPWLLPKKKVKRMHGFGLYTILPSSILYGVWHKHGGSVAGRILRNGRALVLQ